jgi:undecaprenyl-diphosphatase
MDDQGQVIDVAVHVGTLGAVILYFWRDVKLGLSGVPRMLTGRIDTPGSKLAFLLAVATVPVIIAGLILQVTGLARSDAQRHGDRLDHAGLRHRLYWADQKGPETKRDGDWTLRDAITMGLWQAWR